MTLARFLLGVPLGLVLLGPLAYGATLIRRRILPGWTGADAALVDLVLALVALTLLGEVVGTFGGFSLVPLVLGSLGLGAGVAIWSSRSAPSAPAEEESSHRPEPRDEVAGGGRLGSQAGLVLIGGGVVLMVGSWLARTFDALSHGISSVDSNWYHLPVAVRFVQTGRVDGIQVLDPDSVTAYFPATSSVFHAVGLVVFDSDLVSVVINMGWLAVILLAGWCIGRPFGVAPVTLAAAALVFAGPGMVDTQPAGALTDVVGVALILTMVAVALRPAAGARPPAQDVVAALSGGLATGMKFTFLVPVVALGVVLGLTAPAGARLRRLALIAAAGFASGGYWYVRNLVLTGNPLPALDAGLGPFRLHAVEGVANATTVGSLLSDRSAWSEFFLPGLRDAYGPAWFVVLGLAALGMVGAIVRGPEPLIRMLGGVAVLGTLGYVYTPQYLFGGTFFSTNLRYAAPGVVLGLVLLPIVLRQWRAGVGIVLGATLVATQLDRTSWPFGFGADSFFSPVDRGDATVAAVAAVAGLLLTAALVAAWRHWPDRRPPSPALAVAVPVLVVLGLGLVHDRYYDGRYEDFPPIPDAYRWASQVQGANIGLYGDFLAMKYPFAGADLSNRVQYIAVATEDGGFRRPRGCREWIDLVEDGGFDHLAVLTVPGLDKGPTAWTERQPDVRQIHAFPVAGGDQLELRVYQLDPTVTGRRCGR